MTRSRAISVLVGTFALCAGAASGARAAQVPEIPDKLVEIRRLMDSGDWKRADELATAVVSQHGTSYEAYEALGRVKDAERRYDDAEAAYRRAAQLAPNAASPHVSLGVSLVQRGQTALALTEFQEALAKDPRNLAALSNSGSLELAANHFAEAEKHYQRAQQIAPDDPVIVLGLTTAAFGAGDRELAQKTASLLARADSPSIHFSLGLLLAKNGLYAEATEQFEIVAQRGASSPELFLNLGLAYSEQQKYDAAKANYFRAINLNPANPLPYTRVGSDYLAQKKGGLALVWLFRAAKLGQGQPDTLYLLGRALLDEEYFQTAHTYLARYVRLRSNDPKGWLLLGDAFLNDEQPENALESYQKALKLVPQLASAHYLVGNAEYLAKRIPEAKQELLSALRIDPSHAEAQLRLGEIAYRENDADAAASRFRAVLSAHPEDAEARYDLAKVCVRQEQYGEARDLLERVVAQHPDDIRFHYLLSQVYKRLNENDKSEREWTLYRTIKSEQDFQHRFIRHSHLYVE
jgi:tetratricopeptide (TPR) repeat protein